MISKNATDEYMEAVTPTMCRSPKLLWSILLLLLYSDDDDGVDDIDIDDVEDDVEDDEDEDEVVSM